MIRHTPRTNAITPSGESIITTAGNCAAIPGLP